MWIGLVAVRELLIIRATAGDDHQADEDRNAGDPARRAITTTTTTTTTTTSGTTAWPSGYR
jgi:hypothetical protein